jgi:hypothetical protein
MVETRRKRAALAAGTEGLEAELARVRQRVVRDGAVKLSTLRAGALREEICERLVADGFELSGTFVRQPLAVQLHAALHREEAIAMIGLPERVRGASRAELAQAVEACEARGELRRILRGRTEYVVGARHAVLGERRLEALRGAFSDLAKMLDVVSKKKNVGLLASDIEQMLSAAQRVLAEDSVPKSSEEVAPDEAVTAPAPAVAVRPLADLPLAASAAVSLPAAPAAAVLADPVTALLEALDAVRDTRNGMAFVPAIVRLLSAAMPVSEALELLLRAARRELIELRPEGGLGRLSDEELALCPPGPAGTRLSWARRSAGAAA